MRTAGSHDCCLTFLKADNHTTAVVKLSSSCKRGTGQVSLLPRRVREHSAITQTSETSTPGSRKSGGVRHGDWLREITSSGLFGLQLDESPDSHLHHSVHGIGVTHALISRYRFLALSLVTFHINYSHRDATRPDTASKRRNFTPSKCRFKPVLSQFQGQTGCAIVFPEFLTLCTTCLH
ncbi:hypothetical protein E2C01_012784 [Portunus trituberculatus]|uniref:Uncharacterized protein n=1 Tax=Portunus trituberculatus TaxID=210409 RepID=A0A5B7DF04_PORTR|nr:hypothetical protein [Portunus trituberculatus]